jgi:hypothetical protein
MLPTVLHRLGLRGWMLHSSSFGGILLCILLWQRAKTVDQDERGNAERRALFVGLWPPTLWLIGDALEEASREPLRRRALLRVPRRRGGAHQRLARL